MPEAISVEGLEVIGYADVLDPGMLPSIVPPIFRIAAHPGVAFVPPFTLSGGFVYGASEIGDAELRELHDAGEIVLFEEPFRAVSEYELWLDESNGIHFDPRAAAKNYLNQFATQSIEQARVALIGGDFLRAEQFCSAAIAANDKYLEAFAIKAAIRHRQHDIAGERLMGELVSPYLKQSSFRLLVEAYLPYGCQPGPQVSEQSLNMVPPMRSMATYSAAA